MTIVQKSGRMYQNVGIDILDDEITNIIDRALMVNCESIDWGVRRWVYIVRRE
jgi:hypothetical protein